jgi:hypothetical protein
MMHLKIDMESQYVQLRRASARRAGRKTVVLAVVVAAGISGVEWYHGRDWLHVVLPFPSIVIGAPALYALSLVAERATR